MTKKEILKHAVFFGSSIGKDFEYKKEKVKCIGLLYFESEDVLKIIFRPEKNHDISFFLPRDQDKLTEIIPL